MGSDTNLEDVVLRCIPFMLGTLPPGTFHDAYQALLSLQKVLNLANEGSGCNAPIVTSAPHTTKCCSFSELTSMPEDCYAIHSLSKWGVSEAITPKLSSEDVTKV